MPCIWRQISSHPQASDHICTTLPVYPVGMYSQIACITWLFLYDTHINGIIEDTMHYMYTCHVSGTRYSVFYSDTYLPPMPIQSVFHEITATSQISQMHRIRVIASIACMRVYSSYRYLLMTYRTHTAYAYIVCSCGIMCRAYIRMHSILLLLYYNSIHIRMQCSSSSSISTLVPMTTRYDSMRICTSAYHVSADPNLRLIGYATISMLNPHPPSDTKNNHFLCTFPS